MMMTMIRLPSMGARFASAARLARANQGIVCGTSTAARLASTIPPNAPRAAMSVLDDGRHANSDFVVLSACAVIMAATAVTTASCEQEAFQTTQQSKKKKKRRQTSRTELNVADVVQDNRDNDNNNDNDNDNYDSLPVYTSDQVSQHNGQQQQDEDNDSDDQSIWMTYGGIVYDVTDFIANHPGGSDKILQAAGSAIEPYWHLYRQHFASDLPLQLLQRMAIGRLRDEDQAAIDEGLEELSKDDPYSMEPIQSRHRSLIVHSDQPMNAEVPAHILTNNYLTPNSLFYIRHHHPVPYLTPRQMETFKLKVDGSAYTKGGKVVELSLDELKKMPQTTITATLQCSGNRRSGFNTFQRTSGTPWGQGAISTAQFTGVPLRDVLKAAGVEDCIAAEEAFGLQHVRFQALDGMEASIGIEKACNPYGDVIVCYEMNGEPLPREHGFPLRVVVPGYAAVRNVKWLDRIELSKTEAEGPWQQGLNYKTLPPGVTDAKNINLKEMPSMTEVSVFSGITKIQRQADEHAKPGDRVKVKVQGWAWAGGGRNIVRVDVTGDGGKSWNTAELLMGKEQKFGRAWAWTFWECEVPEAIVSENGTIQLASKAVDLAFNVQPESADHSWNVRGLGNNSWYKAELHV